MAAHVKVRGKWKEIKVNPNVFIENDMTDFVCMRELTDYDVVDISGKHNSLKNIKNIKKTKHKESDLRQNHGDGVQSEEKLTQKKKKKKCKKSKAKKPDADLSSNDIPVNNVSLSSDDIPKSNKKRKKSKKKNTNPGNIESQTSKKRCGKDINIDTDLPHAKRKRKDTSYLSDPSLEKTLTSEPSDMSAWKGLFVPEPVIEALAEDNFTAPTPIQTLALAPAIRDKKDIVGAAETGSGKTLAFGIPLIHSILKLKEEGCIPETSTKEISQDADMAEDTDDDLSGDELDDHEALLDNDLEDLDVPTDSDPEEMSDSDRSGDEFSEQKPVQKELPLYALVLTPTRELAIQVKNHIQRAARHTGIQVITVVGGMAMQKQERLLKKQPEIVVATPGRLWELLQEGEPHLAKINNIRCLVIDEADRMVEKGHFEELSKLLALINSDEAKKAKRQTFVFSATLTFVHSGPNRLKYQKKAVQMTEKQKLESLMSHIGIKPKPKIIDLTRAVRTAETLTEARLTCAVDEKDFYLYYFLQRYPGRTLVFANSKDCIRRLVSIFKLLQCCPLPLHADMHQRQRLKNLDRFKGNPRGLLLATDVAARGLDIPDVKHVIHYQVPRTTENYVHRSGRTARATKEGLSVMLVSPEDLQYYRKINKSLSRDEDLPLFPVEQSLLPGVKARVNTARYIDKKEHSHNKQKHENNWYQKAAKEMDIELDEDILLNDLGDKQEQAELKQDLEAARHDLKAMLKDPLERQNYFGKYPTKSGKLQLSTYQDDSAVARAKDAGKLEKKLLHEHHIKPAIGHRKKKKKFKKKAKH